MTICQECRREDNHSEVNIYNLLVMDNVSKSFMQSVYSPLIVQQLFIYM